MGLAGEPSHPDVQSAVLTTIKRIVKTGIPAGFLSADEAFADAVTDTGATFVSRDIDMAALKRGLKQRLNN